MGNVWTKYKISVLKIQFNWNLIFLVQSSKWFYTHFVDKNDAGSMQLKMGILNIHLISRQAIKRTCHSFQ